MDLLPFIQQAIKQTEGQLEYLNNFKQKGTQKVKTENINHLNIQMKQKSSSGPRDQQTENFVAENNDDCYYFYQSSTGENLFLHPICYKLFHQQFNQDYSKYPLQITSKVDEIEYDLLLMETMETQAKKYKYLDFLPDNTPFGIVEIDMRPFVKAKIISNEVYDDNSKQLQARHRNRQKRIKGEETYNNKVQQL